MTDDGTPGASFASVTREQLARRAAAQAERERTRILRDADRRHARYLDEPDESDLVVLWSEPPGFDTALDDWPERVHGFDANDPCDTEWDRESARQRAERR